MTTTARHCTRGQAARTHAQFSCEPQMSGKGRRHVTMETSRNLLQKSFGLQGEIKRGPIKRRLLSAREQKLSANLETQSRSNPFASIFLAVSKQSRLTDEFLVPDVQSHVPQSCGHGTNHPVIVYPQQLHQDRKTLLFTDCSSDINGPLRRAEGRA